MKTKVFVSCGQRKDSSEIEIAKEVQKVLGRLGFEAYVATEEQSLKGLKENILTQLETSEYFIFIDFPREKLDSGNSHRGSLFSHQELAVASYLDLPVIAFQEKGLKPEDGILRFIQGNLIQFDDRSKLPKLIESQVKKAKWRTDWKNQLECKLSDPPFNEAIDVRNNEQGRYFHITVYNSHFRKTALNCSGYLTKYIKLDEGSHEPMTVELKWAGYVYPSVNIWPKSQRNLDAFHVYQAGPSELKFNLFTDSGHYQIWDVKGPGKFLLEYVVRSENFIDSHINLKVSIGKDIDDLDVLMVSPT